ncbi:hypothetical protein [Paragemmobacter straminiformis]|uniref:PLD-like domain-containing protein n=1 Tax=Paragemmobacter straminiformis TaxID=2045119 RepID=A0A842I662_9RHOB|nr:hypothetical protein [Gemmobacter straminiformis]MBC2835149.1 hypothetical protein [Gemmobacter straminiformis]
MDELLKDGFLSRIFSRRSSASVRVEGQVNGSERGSENWADNRHKTVRTLVHEVLSSPACLIVTGYQDFLSALTIILESVPDIASRPPGSIRIVFGTNSDSSRTVGGAGRSVSDEARSHFLGARGLAVSDLADLRAILALEAIERGAISFRAFDANKAAETLGKRPTMLHAKLYVSKERVLSGSANFSNAGMRSNLEFIDDVSDYPDLAKARRESAEAFWKMGEDWTETALEILRGLIRLVSAEEAAARSYVEMTGFIPWMVGGLTSAGRPPQPFQAELVYEAAGTIYEHGFAFVEAPTGAGKTDIGKHLAVVLPVTHGETVLSTGERADQRRLGTLALVPASVHGNWEKNSSSNLSLIKHSHLSKKAREEEAEMNEINRKIQSSASMIVDESHRMSSRYLAPSARSIVFEQSPAIWTACLSATLMGNQGLDGLLAFHEKRSSIYVPPQITSRINEHMAKVRRRSELIRNLQELEDRMAARQVQGDLFERPEVLAEELRRTKSLIVEGGLEPRQIQSDLAASLAPYVVRRQRDCIGESPNRSKSHFTYPPIRLERLDADLTEQQARVIARIKDLAEAITTGTTLVSADPKRAGQAEIRFHDKSRIHIRNFLAVLRSSISFARIEWTQERDSETDQRGRASIGESLRRAERQSRRALQVPPGELPEERPSGDDDSKTPICDRIRRLLDVPALVEIDVQRAKQMADILNRHVQVIFLAERIGVLEVYANLLVRNARKDAEIFVVAPGVPTFGQSKIKHLRSGSDAQDYLAIDGKKADPLKQRAMFLTFQMAEGINLQRASALGIIGVTSDIKAMIQGLGRIDRIDSPHSKIHYFTFDLPGLVLSSDKKARERVESLALLSGVGAKDLPSALVEFAAGDVTELIVRQIRKPRELRPNNKFDMLTRLGRRLNASLVEDMRSNRPRGLWGADLCLLKGKEPSTILVLNGEAGSLRDGCVLPPRLVAVRESGSELIVTGDQSETARLLDDAYALTEAQGRHHVRPTLQDVQDTLSRLLETFGGLTHWDIRPARTVSLLSSLSKFLGSDKSDDGHDLLGSLTLPCLEKLAETWAAILDPSWIRAKQQISSRSKSGIEIPDYLGIEAITRVFLDEPEAYIQSAHDAMQELLDGCRAASDGQTISLLDRVGVIFSVQRS